uniref:Putative secreted protein n=1 Tax=Ixodes ricinus TaxID=34613 RepID=A0A6B0V1W5_IXORI
MISRSLLFAEVLWMRTLAWYFEGQLSRLPTRAAYEGWLERPGAGWFTSAPRIITGSSKMAGRLLMVLASPPHLAFTLWHRLTKSAGRGCCNIFSTTLKTFFSMQHWVARPRSLSQINFMASWLSFIGLRMIRRNLKLAAILFRTVPSTSSSLNMYTSPRLSTTIPSLVATSWNFRRNLSRRSTVSRREKLSTAHLSTLAGCRNLEERRSH